MRIGMRTHISLAIALVAIAALPGQAPAQSSTVTLSVDSVSSVSLKRDLAVRADLRRDSAPAPTPAFPSMPFELLGLGAALSTAKKASRRSSRGGSADSSTTDAADTTGDGGAGGADDSGNDPGAGASDGGEAADKPARAEARSRSKAAAKEERLPQVLTGGFDVRRGEKVFRIPAGTVVEDAELTDDEWDQCVSNNLVREAKYSEVVAAKQRAAGEAHEAKALEKRKAEIGVRPKKAAGDKAPAGAHLVADLEVGRTEVQNAQVARSIAREEVQRGTSERAKMLSGKSS